MSTEVRTGARGGLCSRIGRGSSAQGTIPGGVHSNIRLAEQPHPLFFDHGYDGPPVDLDGNDLIDYVLANGPLLLGHSPRPVIEAVKKQLDRGLIYAGQTDLEVEASERIVEMVPCAERVRFNMTGTEAVQAALRIARAATGRQKVLVFQGHYDGWADNVLFNTGTTGPSLRRHGCRPASSRRSPKSPGRRDGGRVRTWWSPSGTTPTPIEAVLARHRDELAAVIMEPIMGNSGVIAPRPGLPRDRSRPLHPLRDRPDLRRDHHGLPRRARAARRAASA